MAIIMLTVTIPTELAERLFRAARDQGKRADEAALVAIRVWVEDSEEAARNRARFGVAEGQQIFDDFTD